MALLYTTTKKRPYQQNEATVTLNGSGTGSVAVVFDPAFVSAPQVMVITAAGDSGTIAAASITKTGFTLNVTTSLRLSQDIQVSWYAAEKA